MLWILMLVGCLVDPAAYDDRRAELETPVHADCDEDGWPDREHVGRLGNPLECGSSWLVAPEGGWSAWDCDDEDPESDLRVGSRCAHEIADDFAWETFDDTQLLLGFGPYLAIAQASARCQDWGGDLADLGDLERHDWVRARLPVRSGVWVGAQRVEDLWTWEHSVVEPLCIENPVEHLVLNGSDECYSAPASIDEQHPTEVQGFVCERGNPGLDNP